MSALTEETKALAKKNYIGIYRYKKETLDVDCCSVESVIEFLSSIPKSESTRVSCYQDDYLGNSELIVEYGIELSEEEVSSQIRRFLDAKKSIKNKKTKK